MGRVMPQSLMLGTTCIKVYPMVTVTKRLLMLLFSIKFSD